MKLFTEVEIKQLAEWMDQLFYEQLVDTLPPLKTPRRPSRLKPMAFAVRKAWCRA